MSLRLRRQNNWLVTGMTAGMKVNLRVRQRWKTREAAEDYFLSRTDRTVLSSVGVSYGFDMNPSIASSTIRVLIATSR